MTPAGSGAKGQRHHPRHPGSTVHQSSPQQAVLVTALTPPPAVKATATAAPYPPTPSPATSLRSRCQVRRPGKLQEPGLCRIRRFLRTAHRRRRRGCSRWRWRRERDHLGVSHADPGTNLNGQMRRRCGALGSDASPQFDAAGSASAAAGSAQRHPRPET